MKKIISGKVRDVFEINEKELVIVTTDRISAFDVILKSTIQGKGVALDRTVPPADQRQPLLERHSRRLCGAGQNRV